MTDTLPEIARGPESLTRLERRWLKQRFCGWCEAPTHVNACYARSDLGKPCTPDELNKRRGKWLSENYRPRTHILTEGQQPLNQEEKSNG